MQMHGVERYKMLFRSKSCGDVPPRGKPSVNGNVELQVEMYVSVVGVSLETARHEAEHEH